MSKKKPKLPPAGLILEALAGVLAMGLPYEKGVCTSCKVAQGKKHHAGCVYRDAIMLVLKYHRRA